MKGSPIHWLVCREQNTDGLSAVDESNASTSKASEPQRSQVCFVVPPGVRLTNCHFKQPQRNGISPVNQLPHRIRFGWIICN